MTDATDPAKLLISPDVECYEETSLCCLASLFRCDLGNIVAGVVDAGRNLLDSVAQSRCFRKRGECSLRACASASCTEISSAGAATGSLYSRM